jgi:hypothetical protein
MKLLLGLLTSRKRYSQTFIVTAIIIHLYILDSKLERPILQCLYDKEFRGAKSDVHDFQPFCTVFTDYGDSYILILDRQI